MHWTMLETIQQTSLHYEDQIRNGHSYVKSQLAWNGCLIGLKGKMTCEILPFYQIILYLYNHVLNSGKWGCLIKPTVIK